MPSNKKVYFASDLHLRKAPDKTSRKREKDFVLWLDAIKADAGMIVLLGDMFDYWFEYRYVVPRGFVRLLAKLQELTESGIQVHYFAGNHDMWLLDYLHTETGVTVHRKPEEFQINGKTFLLGHGHNLGPAGWGERLLNMVFTSRLLKIFFVAIHPRWTMAFGHAWSKHNRNKHGWAAKFVDIEKEILVHYVRKQLQHRYYDYFVFGHRHLALDIGLSSGSRYINTGEWVNGDTYAVFDGNVLQLCSHSGETDIIRIGR
ncbi:MAG: UDP-2,3-diacylglucosamine diphosphatase [Bacteroidales bacterium]|nr:UDP-2,3-diacylglucosamine diphosphatase [Bacteroidales bacterium]